KRTMFIVLITKSYDKSVWCNFSVHCLILIMLYSQKRLSVTGNSGNWRLKRTWSRALLNFSA
ncbi:hypothetical protein, partial [Bacteroides xylanisolvens]|uniref:hypothetical protein n=1 Tax=Bacteroides xylanisolvens TaxID=371601 RepID=UPI003563C97A